VGRLVDSYLAARGSGDSREPAALTAIDALEQTLSMLHARGRDAHPALAVDDLGFAAHLGRCGATIATGDAAPDLHAEDLYLCCAGLLGSQAAARVLRSNHRAVVVNYLRSIDGSPEFIEEVEQRLWQSALAGSPDAPPKLLSYSGRGPLASWTGVVAQRIALSILRHEDAEKRAHDGAATEARLALVDPELDFVKASLRDSFQRALTDALRTLDDRQLMVYRLHIVDALTVEAIAEMYGVVRSTVTRWLAGARAAVIAETKRLLRDEMRVPPEEFESLARLLTSQLDLNISQILTSS
jgi:RNA polymerase sigma-70 factor (ECF subfamily)